MTTYEDIRIVDATQPDSDAVWDFVYITHPDTSLWSSGVWRITNRPGGAVVAGGSFSFSDFQVAAPELGDELIGGLELVIPWDATLAGAVRSLPARVLEVAWHQLTEQNIGSTDPFPDPWGVEGIVDTVEIARDRITLSCVARQPLDVRAGVYYDLDRFPSLESFQTAGEFQYPPESEA